MDAGNVVLFLRPRRPFAGVVVARSGGSGMTPLPLPNLDYVVLLCRDLAPMRRFYHELLGLPVYRDWPDWLELQVGSSLLTLRLRGRSYDGGVPSGSASVQLAFRVTPDDLDAWHAQLAAQGV